MAYTPHPYFRTRYREALWQREELHGYKQGRGAKVFCNICDKEVVKFVDDFDESHDPAQPRVFGGKSVGIAHSLCNRLHGAQVVRPQVAKCDRIRKRHLGIKKPGMGRHPLAAGVLTKITRTMRGRVKPRQSHAEKHAAFLARRFGFGCVDLPTVQQE